jgi:hypothetical protein
VADYRDGFIDIKSGKGLIRAFEHYLDGSNGFCAREIKLQENKKGNNIKKLNFDFKPNF